MNKWNDYFKVVQIEKDGAGASMWMLDEHYTYEIHDPDGKVMGSYKDQKYAIKQAKYKFRKLLAKWEKILLR